MAMFYAINRLETQVLVFDKRAERDEFLNEHETWYKGESHKAKTVMLHALRSDDAPEALFIKYRYEPMADLLHYMPMREIVDDYRRLCDHAE